MPDETILTESTIPSRKHQIDTVLRRAKLIWQR